MKRAMECLAFMVAIIIVVWTAIWFPWLSLCAVVSLIVGFIFGNVHRAKIERGKSKTLGDEIIRLRNFKASVQTLCDKLR